MKKFFGYARHHGVKTFSIAKIADSIPMFDTFHFRENSAHRKTLTQHIGHHMRILIAEHIANKVPEARYTEMHKGMPTLTKAKPLSRCVPARHCRVWPAREQGESRALRPGLLGPRILGRKGGADPFRDALQIRTPVGYQLANAPDGLPGGNQWEFKEDTDPKFIEQVFGEEQKAQLAALRGRPSGSDPEQSSTMMRDEVLERAPFPAEPMRPLPAANMFVGDTRDLRVGFTRQDDYDLDEMLGTDTDFYDQLPVADLKEYGQSDMLEMRRRSHAHHLKTAFTGIVLGSIRANELRFDGPWVRLRELLTVFNEHAKSLWAYTKSSRSFAKTTSSGSSSQARSRIQELSITASRFTRSGFELRMVTMFVWSWMIRTLPRSAGLPWCPMSKDH